jgi:hypothetical protein
MDLVRQQKYNEFLNLLDKASLPSTMTLGVKECIRQGAGDRSRLCVKRSDDAFTLNIYGYLEFENTAMGAWQAFLIDRLWHSLPLWWHDNYNKRDYIYSKEDIYKITHFVDRHFDALVLEKYDLTPDQLRIEITESAYVENPKKQIEATDKLRKLGFQVEMDDFGSGYSSLNMLKEVPVDRIKLDLNFLTSTGDLKKSHIILSSIIKMLASLKVKMIAEGVETKEQADFLLSEGCANMQGYYFYKPMPVEDYSKLIIKNKDDKK